MKPEKNGFRKTDDEQRVLYEYVCVHVRACMLDLLLSKRSTRTRLCSLGGEGFWRKKLKSKTNFWMGLN